MGAGGAGAKYLYGEALEVLRARRRGEVIDLVEPAFDPKGRVTSCSTYSKPGSVSRWATFSLVPVLRLSTQTTP